MLQAVIFDMDGSLIDSMWIWKAIDTEYLGRFGIALPEDLQESIGGKSFTETAVYFKERFSIPDDIVQIKEEWNRMAWDKYANEVPLKSGAEEFLQLCSQRKLRLGIATSNSRELVDHIVRVHGLERYFECIVTGCEVEKGKPSPDIYLTVAQKLSVKPENCLVFEDIVQGIQAGKAAGMKVCAVDDIHSRAQEMEKRALADYYIEDYKQLTDSFFDEIAVE